jgi:23S rRNA (cytidine1920-2'-O)/16S rRNA (cytidine1409-2'-O)-methyltransferase
MGMQCRLWFGGCRVKKRLDTCIQERHPEYSRTYISAKIKAGGVQVDGKTITKPGVLVVPDAVITIDDLEQKYVCRAGFKLEAALDHFGLDVTGAVALDAGLSTGGFTDCLLQRGALRVYGVDVGHGQVHPRIAGDDRVVVMEKTNLRELASLPEPLTLVTLDLSFIPTALVLPAVAALCAPGAQLCILVKPQFEAGREYVRTGGLVTDPQGHVVALERVLAAARECGLVQEGAVFTSPLPGAVSGNTEFFVVLRK